MARELVTEKGIGERADAVWSALQKRQKEVFAVKSSAEIPPAPVAETVGPAESEPSVPPGSHI